MHCAIKKDKIISLIPARGGSKGLPNKNIISIKGFPLIAYSIIACRLLEENSRTIVTTDSEKIAEIARFYGAEVPFLRPSEISGDKSKDIEFVLHAINWLSENEGEVPEYLLHMRPTAPLRHENIMKEAIKTIKSNCDATSLRTGHKAMESPFKSFFKSDSGYFESISEGISNDEANNARQNFRQVYTPNSYIDILKTEFIINENQMHGDRMIGFETPRCYDVDEEEDILLVEYQIERLGSKVYDYLCEYYEKQE